MMTTALLPLEASTPALCLATGRRHTADTILDAWRADKSPHTLRSYEHDLDAFARFLSSALVVPPLAIEPALARLFAQDSASAHEIVLAFRASLVAAHLAAASINRRLATLRSVSKLARMLGLVQGGWYLEVPGVKAERRRDTRGPAVEDIRRMLAATTADTETATRDAAIVVVLFGLGLRVSELCGLTLEETDLARGTTWITGKGRRERELVPLPVPVVDALRRYLSPIEGPPARDRSLSAGPAGERAMAPGGSTRARFCGSSTGWDNGSVCASGAMRCATAPLRRPSSAGSRPASASIRFVRSPGIERSRRC